MMGHARSEHLWRVNAVRWLTAKRLSQASLETRNMQPSEACQHMPAARELLAEEIRAEAEDAAEPFGDTRVEMGEERRAMKHARSAWW